MMAGIWAARSAEHARVVVLEGAPKLGAKILISGGGRCNVTHHAVESADFAGSTPPAIRKVLTRFDVARTIEFFEELGVRLKREETGKLFPVTDDARSVLDALETATREAGAEIVHPMRVERIHGANGSFTLECERATLVAKRVILATGGRSLPRTGSDGSGYDIVRTLGHTVTRVFPALVPLRLPDGDALRELSGLSTDCVLTVRSRTGKKLVAVEGAVLCTHFGISGPAVLDVSRHLLDARHTDTDAYLTCDWLPSLATDELDEMLRAPGAGSAASRMRRYLPERLAQSLSMRAGVEPSIPAAQLARDGRIAIVRTAKELLLPVTGDRGWDFAEVTAGGVPLAELDLATLESRVCAGLHLCGEICDVDGRIGGFNFQWAWASGFVAGTAAAAELS